MFLGTHTPRLDDKGRLALPAQVPPRSGRGPGDQQGPGPLPVRLPDRRVHPVHRALRDAPVTDRRVRDYGRVLFASASHETPDGQGRITVPAAAARATPG